MPHQRILLIGCGGSGKSTLARKLGDATGLPVIHLDQLYWKPGWQHLSTEEFSEVLGRELSKPRWIMDGNYDRTIPLRLEHCDTVIYLDLPRMVCLFSVIRRVLASYGRTRPDMGAGWPERFDLSFLQWVWNFNRNKREKYLALLASCGKTVYHIRFRRELPDLIRRLSE